MAKITLTTITSGYGTVDALNANFAAIASAFENTMSRDGTSPNATLADVDMNHKRLLNLPSPLTNGEPLRLLDLQNFLAGTVLANLVPIVDAGNYFTAVEVESALQEVGAALATVTGNIATNASAISTNATNIGNNATAISNHLADTTDAHDASAISVVATGNLSSTDVQAALQEHQGDIDSLGGNTITAGFVAYFGANAAPTGWLKANGAVVSRTTYAALFAAVGTTFGVGDGSTTFGLPDLRGEFLRGWDDGRGVDTARVFGSAQTDDFKSHVHLIGTANAIGGAGGGGTLASPSNVNSGATGGTETRPRNIALLACIKY